MSINYRIFLDANIIFSASRIGSPMHQFLEFLLSKKINICSHEFPMEEARRNLSQKRSEWLVGFEQLKFQIELVDHLAVLSKVELAEKDRPILAAAIGCSATHLLTGDLKYFSHLFGKKVSGVKCVTAEMLVKELKIN